MIFGTRLGGDALSQCCIGMHYHDTVWRCAIVVLYHDAVLQCLIAMHLLMQYFVRFAMRCRSALLRGGVAMQQCSSSSRFIILGHLCDVLLWGILQCFLKWGFGSKDLCCNTFGCSAVYRDVWISHE